VRALFLVLLPVILASGLASAAEPVSEAAKSYRIETEGTTRQLKAGAAGKLVLAIVPLNGAHVHPAAPLHIGLSATPGLKLSRDALGHQDAIDPKADGPRFEVPFTASQAGGQEARVKVDFFICSDQWCVKQSRDVAVPVDVK
jgi:hypothetical protein